MNQKREKIFRRGRKLEAPGVFAQPSPVMPEFRRKTRHTLPKPHAVPRPAKMGEFVHNKIIQHLGWRHCQTDAERKRAAFGRAASPQCFLIPDHDRAMLLCHVAAPLGKTFADSPSRFFVKETSYRRGGQIEAAMGNLKVERAVSNRDRTKARQQLALSNFNAKRLPTEKKMSGRSASLLHTLVVARELPFDPLREPTEKELVGNVFETRRFDDLKTVVGKTQSQTPAPGRSAELVWNGSPVDDDGLFGGVRYLV